MKLTSWMVGGGSLLRTSAARKLLLVCAALVIAVPASAGVRGFRGGFGYGPRFGPWAYGYDPFFYYGAYPIVSHPNAGQLKLDTKVKDAEVFVNGAFAGTAGELKSVWLRQGAYNIEVRSPGRTTYSEKVYVVNGKTLHLRPDLRVEPKS